MVAGDAYGSKYTLFSFFKALWWPGFFCKFLASQTYDFNPNFLSR